MHKPKVTSETPCRDGVSTYADAHTLMGMRNERMRHDERGEDHVEDNVEDGDAPDATPGWSWMRRPIAIARTIGGAVASSSRRTRVAMSCVLLCLIVLLLPSPYVVEAPGPTQDVLGTSGGDPVIAITGAKTAKRVGGGKLLLVTVNAAGTPQFPVMTAWALVSWLNPQRTVTPSEAVFPVGQSSKQYAERSSREMTGSQKAASRTALDYLSGLGVDTRGVKVAMHVNDIGGPSAGMMYALGVIDELTPGDATGGAAIAGTGTIDAKGKVGAIGGIRLKMLGAKRDGATWFLAPEVNCAEVVGHVPQGLRDVRVSTLDDAYRAVLAIGKGQTASLPHCTVPRT